jgi:chromosome segregation ATPase
MIFMSNFVKVDENGMAYVIPVGVKCFITEHVLDGIKGKIKWDGCIYVGPAIDRLHEFEKIGMEPDDIVGKLKMLNDLLAERKELVADNNKLTLEVERLNNLYDGCVNDLVISLNKRASIEKDNETLKETIGTLTENCEALVNNISELEAENEKLKNEVNKLKVDYGLLLTKNFNLNMLVKSGLNSIYGANGQYGSYDVRQGIIDHLEAENKKLKNNLEMEEKLNKKLLGQIDKLEDDLRTTLYDSQLKISELEESEQNLKETLVERDEEIKNLKASIGELSLSRIREANLVVALRQENGELKQKLDDIKTYVDKLDGGNDE